MARKNRPAPIVAELGRPETPAETAARKAENSRLHRQRQTVNNLVFSLLASLGVVLILVLAVPRGVGDFEDRSVDVASLAEQAAPSAGQPLASPLLDDAWKAKQAELRSSTTDRVTHWYVGYTTPDEQYAALLQAFTPEGEPASETWVAERLERQVATGTEQIAGLTWTVYDHRDQHADETNVRYGLSTELGSAVLVIFGTDEPEVIEHLATQAVASLGDAASATGTSTPSKG